jgi:apolipoprotein N-acyltransferase
LLSAVRGQLAQLALLVVSAAVLGLAFPRTDWDGAAWIALVPLFIAVLGASPRMALVWAWLYGTVFFLMLLRWLNFTFQTFSAIPWPLTWGPILLLSLWCGLYIAAVGALVAWLQQRRSTEWALVTAPLLWVGAEWLRGHLLGGFPWGTLGYSQYLRLPVIQIAELGGVAAVSFVVAAVNAALAGVFLLGWRSAVTGLVLAGSLVGATLGFGTWRLREPMSPERVSVAIMQPSIEQPLKWDPDHATVVLKIYQELTRQAGADRPGLIVWPETASPTALRRDEALQRTLAGMSKEMQIPLLVGSIDVLDGAPRRFTNTAFLVTEAGIVGRYDKIHLVPFGEYVPLSRVIGFVRGWAEFIAELEPGSRAVVFQGPPAPFGVVICYEGIFPDLFRRFVNGGARMMVNMTNDGWFGRTSGPPQHLGMYPFRAVEHRIAVVRAANTGVSAFIAPTGQIVRHLGLYSRGTITDWVPLRRGRTLFTRVGDWVSWLSLGLAAASIGVAARRKACSAS